MKLVQHVYVYAHVTNFGLINFCPCHMIKIEHLDTSTYGVYPWFPYDRTAVIIYQHLGICLWKSSISMCRCPLSSIRIKLPTYPFCKDMGTTSSSQRLNVCEVMYYLHPVITYTHRVSFWGNMLIWSCKVWSASQVWCMVCPQAKHLRYIKLRIYAHYY